MAPGDLSLQLQPARGTGTYSFRCPHCDQIQQRPANHRVVSILLATGVSYEVVGTEIPITEQEIDEFVASLDGDKWREHLPS